METWKDVDVASDDDLEYHANELMNEFAGCETLGWDARNYNGEIVAQSWGVASKTFYYRLVQMVDFYNQVYRHESAEILSSIESEILGDDDASQD